MWKPPYHLSCLVTCFDSRAPSDPFYLGLRITLIQNCWNIRRNAHFYFLAASRAYWHRNDGLWCNALPAKLPLSPPLQPCILSLKNYENRFFYNFSNILVYSWFTILIAEFRGTEARMIVPCSPLELSTGDGFNHIPTLIPRQECSLCMCCQLAIFGTIWARWVGWLNKMEVYMGWYPASLVYRLQCLQAITPG